MHANHQSVGKPRMRPVLRIAGVACALLLVTIFAAGCKGSSQRPPTSPPPPASTPGSVSQSRAPSSTASEATITSPPRGRLAFGLTPAQLAGQRVIYGYRGLTPPPRLLSLIRNGEAAGVIFFSDNVESTTQIRHVAQRLQQANLSSSNPIHAPLLLMVDQEGGRVRRLPGPPLLSEKQIGRAADSETKAAEAGADAARTLSEAGLNVNLAPVLDVYRHEGNFDDKYGRAYSSDPVVVSRLGAQFVRAQQSRGVVAVAKHFPGLGTARASQDTDAGRVILPVSAATLQSVDALPFKSAIGEGVGMVMVSWAIYPAYDPKVPAGFSAKIVRNQLRENLGFRGVTVSDGILADALQPYGGVASRSRLAAAAGIDLLICAKLKSPVSVGTSAKTELESDYRSSRLNRRAFEASVGRVIALRRSLTR